MHWQSSSPHSPLSCIWVWFSFHSYSKPPFVAQYSKTIRLQAFRGTNRSFWGTNCSVLLLRKQYFSCKSAVFGIAAEITAKAVYNSVYSDKSQTMPFALGAVKDSPTFLHLLLGG